MNVTDLVFAEIREIPNVPDYQMMHADGIIGLAYNSIARTTNPFFYKLLADKKILKPIFSVYLNRWILQQVFSLKDENKNCMFIK